MRAGRSTPRRRQRHGLQLHRREVRRVPREETVTMRRSARRLAVGGELLALAAAAFASAGPRTAAAEERVADRFGWVRFVTQQRVYLDRGSADGLVLHHDVSLFRGPVQVSSCHI